MNAASQPRILIVNAGSSSLKLRVIEPDDRVSAAFDLPAESGRVPADAIGRLGPLQGIDAVGHRVVHGGTEFTRAVLLDEAIERRLHALSDLAPLHQPISLAALDAVRALQPGIPEIACFDTAFFTDLPTEATTYAIPAEWRARWRLRRYGFHGLSHAWASRRAAAMLGVRGDAARLVIAHLGAGCSLAAVVNGKPVDTTMGFTPLEGLVMATRSGSVDPGLLLWLESHAGLSAAERADGLEHRSGLLGLTGTADMREILRRVSAGDGDARLALDVYVHRLAAGIAAMAAAMRGIDALVFTGGVGEHAPEVRRRTVERLGFLGLELDETRERSDDDGDREIGRAGLPARVLVIGAREDLEMARQVREVIGAAARYS